MEQLQLTRTEEIASRLLDLTYAELMDVGEWLSKVSAERPRTDGIEDDRWFADLLHDWARSITDLRDAVDEAA